MQFVTLREQADGPTQTAVLGPRGWVTLASLQSVGLPDAWATDIQSLIAAGAPGVAQVQRALDATPDCATLAAHLDALPLAPVVLRPAKILCVGLNYRKHAAESNMAVPSTPILFSKFANALAAHQDEVL
ncbi:MAG: fumarylacetoacetate hydrolase family protein, partial [Caldilineaceae bacterium]